LITLLKTTVDRETALRSKNSALEQRADLGESRLTDANDQLESAKLWPVFWGVFGGVLGAAAIGAAWGVSKLTSR